MKELGAGVTVDRIGRLHDQEFQQADIIARFRKDSRPNAALYNVIVEFVRQGRVIRQLTISYRVARFVMTPVAVRDIEAGVMLTAGDFRMERRPANSLRDEAPTPDELLRHKLAVGLRAGELIGSDHLRARGSILRGQSVTLIVRSGSILIRTPAKALADAQPGESVSVMRSGTRTPITAMANGNGIVSISLGAEEVLQ